MSFDFNQIFALLTSDSGSLAYHLVLSFAILGALSAALASWRSAIPHARRMVIGLSLLLFFQLILFASSGLAWQGMLNAQVLLPALERAATLLGLIVIIWLWAFPAPQRLADSAALLAGLLALTLITLGSVWWSGVSAAPAGITPGLPAGSAAADVTFNGSWVDTLAEIFALLLVGLGLLILLIRRPAGWGLGAAMLLIEFLGHLFYLIFPNMNTSYPAAVRLSQLAAYPLLFFLPSRTPVAWSVAPASISEREAVKTPRSGKVEAPPGPETARRPAFDPLLVASLLRLGAEGDQRKVCASIAASVSRIMLADVCLVVYPPDESGRMSVACGYDLIRERPLEGGTLSARDAPVLASALAHNYSVRLSYSQEADDLPALADLLKLPQAGHMLAAAVGPRDGPVLLGLVLLTPHSLHVWEPYDQENLLKITSALAPALGRSAALHELQSELDAARQELEKASLESRQLRDQLAQVRQQSDNDRSRLNSLAAVIDAQETAQAALTRLQAENEALKGSAAGPAAASPAEQEKIAELQGELRLALQELAALRQELDEASQGAGEALPEEGQPETALADEQVEEIASIALELRQPMASIVGYTDVLLGESVGILGASQRKFLERIRTAAERMGRLMDDLAAVINRSGRQLELSVEPVELSQVVEEAVSATRPQMESKKIALHLELPEALPSLSADRDALGQVVVQLLQNAGGATPQGGEVLLRASLETREGQPDYILLQVTDSGEGIPHENLPRVFSSIYREDASLPGMGNTGASMFAVKSLVEASGGRIWVDSQLGKGSVFSVLLPVPGPSVPGLRPSKNGNGGDP